MISRKVHFPNVKADRRLAVALVSAMFREQNQHDALNEQIKALLVKQKEAAEKVELFKGFIETLKRSNPAIEHFQS